MLGFGGLVAVLVIAVAAVAWAHDLIHVGRGVAQGMAVDAWNGATLCEQLL